jgi:hypothetical protein
MHPVFLDECVDVAKVRHPLFDKVIGPIPPLDGQQGSYLPFTEPGPQEPVGVPYHYGVRVDVFCHNTTCTYYCPVPDRDPGKYGSIHTYPDVVTDGDAATVRAIGVIPIHDVLERESGHAIVPDTRMAHAYDGDATRHTGEVAYLHRNIKMIGELEPAIRMCT